MTPLEQLIRALVREELEAALVAVLARMPAYAPVAAVAPGAAAYIDDRELARRTGIARITWQHWRWRGEGPPFSKLGRRRLVYKWAEVEAWIAAWIAACAPTGVPAPAKGSKR